MIALVTVCRPAGSRSAMLLFTLLALATVASAAPALAAATPANQTFVGVASGLDLANRVVAVGPFSGVGTNVAVDSTANPDGTFTDTDRFVFSRGQVVFRITYFERVATNSLSRVSTIRDEGTYVLIGGTQAFAGITGGGRFTGSSVGARNATQCPSPSTPPVAAVLVLRGRGITHLPG